jgi:hypothetical protein
VAFLEHGTQAPENDPRPRNRNHSSSTGIGAALGFPREWEIENLGWVSGAIPATFGGGGNVGFWLLEVTELLEWTVVR